jgi:hypothetical protein
MAETKVYVAEFNRTVGDNIRTCQRRLERQGLNVDSVPHKTTLRIERPADMSWHDFKQILRSVIQPLRGAVLLFSRSTGNVFVCSNAGNQPGRFQRID